MPAESLPESHPSADAPHEAPLEPMASGPGTRTNGNHGTLEEFNASFLFDKMLTSSDAGGHGRVVIPKVSISLQLCQMYSRLACHAPAEHVADAVGCTPPGCRYAGARKGSFAVTGRQAGDSCRHDRHIWHPASLPVLLLDQQLQPHVSPGGRRTCPGMLVLYSSFCKHCGIIPADQHRAACSNPHTEIML